MTCPCGGGLEGETVRRFVMRNGSLVQVCRACVKGPRPLGNVFRELGYPDAGGGKVAPGNYQWYSKGDG